MGRKDPSMARLDRLREQAAALNEKVSELERSKGKDEAVADLGEITRLIDAMTPKDPKPESQ